MKFSKAEISGKCPDEFSVAPVIMKDAECSLVNNLIAEKLILPTFHNYSLCISSETDSVPLII